MKKKETCFCLCELEVQDRATRTQISDQLRVYFLTQLHRDDATVPNTMVFPGGIQMDADDHMAETLWFYDIIIPYLLEFKGH